jgi:hypothetical protein
MLAGNLYRGRIDLVYVRVVGGRFRCSLRLKIRNRRFRLAQLTAAGT